MSGHGIAGEIKGYQGPFDKFACGPVDGVGLCFGGFAAPCTGARQKSQSSGTRILKRKLKSRWGQDLLDHDN